MKKYEKTLKSLTNDYFVFYNGQVLWDKLKGMKWCPNCLLLILTDLSMPHMNGVQLAKELKKSNLTVKYKIVLISAEDYDNSEYVFDEV
mmetsp:Transcript_2568/g.2205  ORF Transcript_2568/g.2205 Transcript_2568/m.2205 type:complete len:89 (+) Transcript_2568:934-1200(+)